MEDMASHPHLLVRGTTYHYRRKVPVDLLAHYAPAREITFSLRTKDRREAVQKARREAVRLDEEFARVRAMARAEVRSVIAEAEVDRVVQTYLHEVLGADEAKRFQGSGDDGLHEALRSEVEAGGGRATFGHAEVARTSGMSEREYAKQQETVAVLGEAARAALARGDTSIVDGEVDELLLVHGLKLDPASDARRRVAVALLKATVRAADLLEQRQQGNVVQTPAAPGMVLAAPTLDGDDLTVSGLWERYLADRKPPEKTKSDFGTYVRRFREVCGDLPVRKVTRTHARTFRDAMLRMPARLNKEQAKMTVPALLDTLSEDTTTPRLNPRTVKDKALGALGAVFGFAVNEEYADSNPFSKITVRGPENYEPARLPFTIDELVKIFQSPVFTEGKRPVGGGGEASKWLPLLAAFTGARLEELGKLNVSEVREEASVPFLYILGRVKGKQSRRKVPLHPELIRLGFIDYVEDRRKAKDVRLFPDLKSERTEFTAAFSQWFGRYLRGLGIEDKRKKFHSFRHGVKRQLRNAGLEQALFDALQGHAVRDVSGQYGLDEEGLGFALPVLHGALSKLEYPGLNLDHLVPPKRG
jgi:integrase